jgi:hypothetical protein
MRELLILLYILPPDLSIKNMLTFNFQRPLRPHKTGKPTHVRNGQHNRRAPLPQRSNRPPGRPRHGLWFRSNRKLQLTRWLLARRVPR